jgi:hypothetical protein
LPALNWILLAAAIMLVAAATLFIAGERTWTVFAGPADQGPVNFTTLQLRTSPNQYLVCPADKCTAADQTAPVYAVSEQRLRETLIASWATMPRTRHVSGSADPASGEIRFVQTTAILQYPDTISVHTWPAGDEPLHTGHLLAQPRRPVRPWRQREADKIMARRPAAAPTD